MRDTFVQTLIELAEENENIELLTGDLGFGVLKPFWERLPNQFINAGIAEQNMTSVAAGMALEGKIVFTYSIGNFPTLRCLEQIRNDCAYHNANVKIVCVGGGFVYGSLGMSHQATEDIAVMRALPNVSVFCPGDLVEAKEVTKALVDYPGTCYLRLGRGGEKQIHKEIPDFQLGQAIKVQKSQSNIKVAAIFSTGAILDEVTDAVDILEKNGIGMAQFSVPSVKPLDTEMILKCAEKYSYIITVEEHNIIGGFGSAVAELLAENKTNARLLKIGINDTYCDVVGNQAYLRNKYGLDAVHISNKVRNFINEKA